MTAFPLIFPPCASSVNSLIFSSPSNGFVFTVTPCFAMQSSILTLSSDVHTKEPWILISRNIISLKGTAMVSGCAICTRIPCIFVQAAEMAHASAWSEMQMLLSAPAPLVTACTSFTTCSLPFRASQTTSAP